MKIWTPKEKMNTMEKKEKKTRRHTASVRGEVSELYVALLPSPLSGPLTKPSLR